MPNFIGTRGDFAIFKNEKTGETIEVPLELVDKKLYNKMTNYDTAGQGALDSSNRAKADERYRAQLGTDKPVTNPLYPSGQRDMPPAVIAAYKRAQDEEQARLNKANIAFREQALRDLPSAPVAPTLAPMAPPPGEQLARAETDEDRLKRALLRGPYGPRPAQYKTGMIDRDGNPTDPMRFFR